MSTRLLSRLGAPALLRNNPRHVPAMPCIVDPTHPLARGLVCFYAPGLSFADLNGRYPALTWAASATGLGVTPLGAGIVAGGTTLRGMATPATLPSTTFSGGGSVWCLRLGSGLGGGAWHVGLTGGGNDLVMYTDGGQRTLGMVSGGGFSNTGSGNNVLVDGTMQSMVAVASTGNNGKLYLNGALLTNVGNSSVQPAFHATDVFNLGGDTNGTYVAGAMWSRPLTQQEAMWLRDEPFAMLIPAASRRTYYVPAVGGGGGGRRPFIFFL